MKSLSKRVACFLLFFVIITTRAQTKIPVDRVLSNTELQNYLKEELKGKLSSSDKLARYFRLKFSERFFSDWNKVEERLDTYNILYAPQKKHKSRAEDHMDKFLATTKWQLPFNYIKGKEVNALG